MVKSFNVGAFSQHKSEISVVVKPNKDFVQDQDLNSHDKKKNENRYAKFCHVI